MKIDHIALYCINLEAMHEFWMCDTDHDAQCILGKL